MNRFDEAAKTWDTKPSSLAMAKACVENINKIIKLKDDSKILDYGCGTGLVAFSLSNETNEVIGMDNSSGMVEQFNKKAKELDFLNIKAIQHNIDNEDLTQNEFDLIITSMSLHHIKNANIFIEKAYEALLSREEMVVAIDQGYYFRVPADQRDLNYEKYVEEGDSKITEFEDYNSHNTERLDVEGMKKLLLKLEFVRALTQGQYVDPEA